MIGGVEAEFSLLDFLRDRYKVTKLVLEQPRLELRIDESGALQTGIWLAEAGVDLQRVDRERRDRGRHGAADRCADGGGL